MDESKNIKNTDYEHLISYEGSWCFEESIDNATHNADAVIILTEWEEYSNINWNLISKRMRHPAWVFDSRSIVKKEEVLDANLKLWKVGDGTI